MKIKQNIIDLINTPTQRTKIALRLGCGEQNIAGVIRRNEDNGRLTRMDALEAISAETGFTVEELLERDRVSA
jgi:hypothetical protein